MSEVTIESHGGWAEIILNRPEVKNAINGPLGIALADAFRRVDADDSVNVVVFRGAGGAFCSGLDLKAFNAEPAPEWLDSFQSIWRSAHRAIFECRKPIIGALERYAINGGAALALAADLLVVGDDAFLQVGEAKIGMAAPYNLAWLRLRHSEAVATEIALLGDRHTGAQLKSLGIANRSVPDQQVLEQASALAAQMAEYPAGALARIKTGLRRYGPVSADEWFDLAQVGAPGTPAPKAMER
jgi:enoyl-CoA hydratase/carnithine racemase